MTTRELTVRLKTPHEHQRRFIYSPAKRKVVRAGRRSGKTTGVAMYAVEKFLKPRLPGTDVGHRVLYAAPTQDQTDTFWREVTVALEEPIKAGLYRINQTRRFVERTGTTQRIRAKTAWDANSMRGDFAEVLIFEEYQDMKEEAWTEVGAPMLLDNDGEAIFIYTPKIGEAGLHARELAKKAQEDETGRWEFFNFTSFDNPYLNDVALEEISDDMPKLSYRMEIMAEDIDDNPAALWDRDMIERNRVNVYDDMPYVVVAVDPPAKDGECGIIVGGRKEIDGKMHAFILDDLSLRGKPNRWGERVFYAYSEFYADKIVGEVNNGGDMVESTVKSVRGAETVSFKQVRASRGKATRAEPVSTLYAQNRVHHVGEFAQLEDQLCNWVPGHAQSPDRLDALVWCVTELLLLGRGWVRGAV